MKRENVKVITILCSIVIAGMAFAANASAQCSRETLQKLADKRQRRDELHEISWTRVAPVDDFVDAGEFGL